MNGKLESMFLRRLKEAGFHPEGVLLVCVMRFPPEACGFFTIYGTPQDEYDDLKKLLATEEFMTFGSGADGFFDALWIKDISSLLGADTGTAK